MFTTQKSGFTALINKQKKLPVIEAKITKIPKRKSIVAIVESPLKPSTKKKNKVGLKSFTRSNTPYQPPYAQLVSIRVF